MKKILLLLALICFLAPAEMAFAASNSAANTNLIIALFSKKTKKAQPKFRPQSRGVYKTR